ncbi:hypothetical protein EBR04_06655, partial [bacterium]|nr:hypothetical protein [bacterium]
MLAVAAALAGATPGPALAEEAVSGARAMQHVVELCDLGPRPSGSAAMAKQRELLVAHFRAAGA